MISAPSVAGALRQGSVKLNAGAVVGHPSSNEAAALKKINFTNIFPNKLSEFLAQGSQGSQGSIESMDSTFEGRGFVYLTEAQGVARTAKNPSSEDAIDLHDISFQVVAARNVTAAQLLVTLEGTIDDLASKKNGRIQKAQIPLELAKLKAIRDTAISAIRDGASTHKHTYENIRKTATTLYNHINHSQFKDKALRDDIYISKEVYKLALKLLSEEPKSSGEVIGKGAYSEVKAIQVGDSHYALKKAIEEPVAESQLRNEAVVIAKMAPHDNIVSVALYDPGAHYMITGLMESNLTSKLSSSSPVEFSKLLDYVKQIASGVAHAHEYGIVLRDIKPDNILVTGDTVKICDFGTAIVASEGSQTRVAGTLPYMAPEGLRGAKNATSIDMWSLGSTVWSMLTGVPFSVDLFQAKSAGGESRSLNQHDFMIFLGNLLSDVDANQEKIDILIDSLGTEGHEIKTCIPESMSKPELAQLKLLLNGMLQLNPEDRFKAEEVVEALA